MRKLARVVSLLALAGVPVAMASTGCEAPRPIHRTLPNGAATAPIIGGAANTSLDAVVAMVSVNDELVCSGTIIAKSGSSGYVLTAAHCGDIAYVVETDTLAACQDGGACRAYEVVESAIHPDYDDCLPDGCPSQEVGYWNDFQMLRIVTVDADTPVIPVATDDQLTVGDALTFAGFGVMDGLASSPGRRSATNVVDDFNFFEIIFSQTTTPGNGGVCFGDSGGFTGKTIDGQLRLIGVNRSVVSESCTGDAQSARISAVYGDFIAPFMNVDPPELTCDQCVEGAFQSPTSECADEIESCFSSDSTPCAILAACIGGCATQLCVNTCASETPAGVAPYNAIIDCGYCSACDTECAAENDFCQDPSSASGGPTVTSAVASTGSGDATVTGAGTTTGTGDLASGAGGAGSDVDADDDGGGDGGGDGDDGATAEPVDEGGCAVGTPGSSGAGAFRGGASGSGSGAGAGLLLAAAALAASRRRRS